MWRSVYDERNEPLMLKQMHNSGLFFDVGPGRLERLVAQKKMVEGAQAADEARQRRLRKEMAFNLQLQLDKARSEVETGRLRGLQDAAVQPRIIYLQNRLAELAPQAPQVAAPGVEALLRQQIEETRAANELGTETEADVPRARVISVDVVKQKLRELRRNADRSWQVLTDNQVAERKRDVQRTIDDLRDGTRQKEELIRLHADAYAENDRKRALMGEEFSDDPASASTDPLPKRRSRAAPKQTPKSSPKAAPKAKARVV